ncbi:MAG TPA: M67 family metallopeptidase [Candidatus Limnocylindrales bacterium]|nr:M67 family metallopeptidase [Candidatus Limnocylindrales bacterium]
MTAAVRIRREIISRMREQARITPEAECCGLLAGRDGIITRVLPARNALDSATAYEIAPEELFRLMRQIRAENLEMMGIYHSHPRGENRPSARDIECACYPEAAYFILSPLADAAQAVRAFSIRDGCVAELKIDTA